ncbi:unnamed protein product, partial [Prorocentrum cordatum]
MTAQSLTITIAGARLHDARGVPLAAGGLVCTCEIPGEPRSRFSTAGASPGAEPAWNYSSEISGVEAGDALEFQVLDQDGSPLAGGKLQGSDFYPQGFRGALPVAGRGASGSLAVLVSPVGCPATLPAPAACAETPCASPWSPEGTQDLQGFERTAAADPAHPYWNSAPSPPLRLFSGDPRFDAQDAEQACGQPLQE